MIGHLRRIYALADKEVRHILRDPRTVYLSLAFPGVMLLLFGFGVSFDLDQLPIALVDLDRSAASRELVRRAAASHDFVAKAHPATVAEAERMLVRGDVLGALVVPRGFEEDLRRGRDVEIQLLLDGSDANSAVQAQGKLDAVVQVVGASLAAPPGLVGLEAPLEARLFTRYNPSARSAVFLVPGLTAYVLAIVAVLLTALTVAREWEKGSMAQLFATPVARIEIVLGKLLPYVVLGSLAVLLVIAMGSWIFDVPFRGSPFALAVLSLLFLVGMLAQGLLISIIAQNQMVATQAGALSSMLPSMLLSGFIFPIENMPVALQWLTAIVPARYYVEGLRGVLLRGNGLGELWAQALALLAFATVVIAVATVRFRRTVA